MHGAAVAVEAAEAAVEAAAVRGRQWDTLGAAAVDHRWGMSAADITRRHAPKPT